MEWYGQVLRRFKEHLEGQGFSIKLGDLTLDVAREYVLHMQTRKKWYGKPAIPHPEGNLAAISVQSYVRALRAFFSWLEREGYTEENILARLNPPQAPQKLAVDRLWMSVA